MAVIPTVGICAYVASRGVPIIALGKKGKLGKQSERRLESLEGRLLLTSGPQLISIIPNDGNLLLPNDTLHSAPTQFTFRFLLGAGEKLDPNTLSGIELTRSGGDGTFGNGNDVQIVPGYEGIDPGQPNQVVMRFSAPLADDLYQIEVVGSGNGALQDTAGVAFDSGNTNNPNYLQDFRLQLGPQVVSVVPQPTTRDASGNLVAQNNEIDVYFNEPVQTLPGDATHLDPAQFQLIATNNTASTSDDKVFVADPNATSIVTKPDGTIHVPGSVIYNPANNKARIVFRQPGSLAPISVNDLAAMAGASGSDAFRLRVGNDTLPLPAPVPPAATGILSQYTALAGNTPSTGDVPPDTQGAAGPNSYVETVNQAIAIYSSKDSPASVLTSSLGNFFFTQGGLSRSGRLRLPERQLRHL